jgi:hypothetical protein
MMGDLPYWYAWEQKINRPQGLGERGRVWYLGTYLEGLYFPEEVTKGEARRLLSSG